MGQFPSKEGARLRVLREEISEVIALIKILQSYASAEATARVPATEGRQAQRHAAEMQLELLVDEAAAIRARLDAQREGRSLPMPKRTPPLILPPVSQPKAQTAPAPASPVGVQPSTPKGSVSSGPLQRGESSSSEEAAPADDADVETPLLAQHDR